MINIITALRCLLSQIQEICCFSREKLPCGATDTIMAMGRRAEVTLVATMDDIGKKTTDMDHAKMVMRLTKTGFNMTYVVAAIKKLARVTSVTYTPTVAN